MPRSADLADLASPAPSAAIEALYVGHHQWLRRWLQTRLGDRHCAEDLAHDTFVRLLAKEEGFPTSSRALLVTVARRVLLNHWRRKRLEAAWLEALARLAPALQPDPETRQILFETLVEIDRLLDGLPTQVRRAFLLTQLDGLSQADVAARLGVSVSTVKRYLLQAMERCYFADLEFATA